MLDELRGSQAVRRLDARGIRALLLPLVRPARANATALDPEPEARAQGSVIHAVLEELYRDPPGGGPVPRPETLDDWRRRAGELIGSDAGEHGLGGDDARGVTSRARMVALIDGFLEREAAARLSSSSRIRELLEASFGEDEGDARPPLELDGLRPARQDRSRRRSGDRRARRADPRLQGLANRHRRRQARRGGKAPAPALRAGPRATVAAAAARRPLPTPGGHGQPPSPRDRTCRRGGRVAGRPRPVPQRPARRRRFRRRPRRRGRARRADRRSDARREITRNPIDDRCPPFCTFQGICRRERSARQEPEATEEEEEDE